MSGDILMNDPQVLRLCSETIRKPFSKADAKPALDDWATP
jgi:hypothetical protein